VVVNSSSTASAVLKLCTSVTLMLLPEEVTGIWILHVPQHQYLQGFQPMTNISTSLEEQLTALANDLAEIE